MQRSIRPRARPSDLGSTANSTPAVADGVGHDSMGTSPQAPTVSPFPRPRPPGLALGPQTPGMYPQIGMQDETDRFKGLGAHPRRGDPSGVILHQTDSHDGDAVRRAYDQRIQQGSSVAAHYLIDKDGTTGLTVPTNEVAYHAIGHNSTDVGIEVVGRANRLDRHGDFHAQIEALDITPRLKERLLAMSPAELKQTMRDNGYAIYGDITGPQKRATWNLLQQLTGEFGLDMKDDVQAHEHVQAKTIGEGENVEEMVDTMVAWPDKIAALEARIAELEAQGGDPQTLAELQERLATEKVLFDAVSRDKTAAENNALEGEGLLGETGPATEREGLREQFWDGFYPHMEGLQEMIS